MGIPSIAFQSRSIPLAGLMLCNFILNADSKEGNVAFSLDVEKGTWSC